MNTGLYYVYILRYEAEPPRFYTGFTEDLDARLGASRRLSPSRIVSKPLLLTAV